LIAKNWAHKIPFILIVDRGFQRLGDLHAGPHGISIPGRLCVSTTGDANRRATTVEHHYKKQVEQDLNNCIGIAVHVASVG